VTRIEGLRATAARAAAPDGAAFIEAQLADIHAGLHALKRPSAQAFLKVFSAFSSAEKQACADAS
jgi:hypothetical protein